MLCRPHSHSCSSSSLSSAGKDGKYRHQDQAVFPQGPHYCHKLLCSSDKASSGSSRFLSYTVILRSHFCPVYVRPTSPTPEPSQSKLEKQKKFQIPSMYWCFNTSCPNEPTKLSKAAYCNGSFQINHFLLSPLC